jgi:transposase
MATVIENAVHAVAGIDPHKRSGTVAVVASTGGLLACESFDISVSGLTTLITVLADAGVVIDRIGVEGSSGLGRPVARALTAAGYDVREVQASRTNDRRRRRHRAKTDITDAQAIAAETLADPGLPPAAKHATDPPAAWEALHTIRTWRESVVLQRVRHLTEAEPVLTSLPLAIRDQLPNTSRVMAALTALPNIKIDRAALRPADQLKLRRLDATRDAVAAINVQLKEIDHQIPNLLTELGCTLTELVGIGVVTAMTLLAEVGDPARFHTEAQFARWCGAAPVAASSGEGHGTPNRHRLDMAGNRQVNSALHIIHVTQARMHDPAKTYLARRKNEGKTPREARRSHKRQLANVLIRHMWKDAKRLKQVPDAETNAAA